MVEDTSYMFVTGKALRSRIHLERIRSDIWSHIMLFLYYYNRSRSRQDGHERRRDQGSFRWRQHPHDQIWSGTRILPQ
jgi:hypothetical protein